MRTGLGAVLGTTPQQDLAIAAGIVVGAVILIVAMAVFAVKRSRAARDPSKWDELLVRAAERARAGGDLGPMVGFTFHTYSGFLASFTQAEHRPRLPAAVAREYLRELHVYNLKQCLIPYPGVVYVPVLSWFNYRTQRRSIQEQAERGSTGARPHGRADL
jgi:hypothetical protein